MTGAKVLLKDIIIPKGTIFLPAPTLMERYSDDHFGADFGLSDNTSGYTEYCIDDDFENEIDPWFTDLK